MADKAMPHALGVLGQQPRVQAFLSAAVLEGRLSHAYLFLGAPGSCMDEAALAVAQTLVCPHGGDASCDECIRVSHRTHPDVHLLTPGSVQGYLVSQVREVIDDVTLAPVRSHAKVYILDNVGLLRGSAANALLKTIEEPPEGVYFILMARSADVVLPTIVSRCQQVPFRVASAGAAEKAVELACGIGGTDARIALSVAQTPERAAAFLASPGRRKVRQCMIGALECLDRADSWDVLERAHEVVEAVQDPLATAKEERAAKVKESADYLGAAALRQLEEADKRELSAQERSGMMEALSAASSLLRDALVRCEGVPEQIVNEDAANVVARIAQFSSAEGVVHALDCVERAADNLSHNVTPQLVIETMLLSIKEALACPPSFR